MCERQPDQWVGAWLAICTLLVAAMVWLGGFTRLTHSGLSIVEWKPVTGIIPPLSALEWQQEFEKYQATPEFRLVNDRMGLPAFQSIYWIEYAHRLLGRALGAVFLVPFLGFSLTRRISTRKTLVLAGCLALGGLQAVVGWYMVKSGLVGEPRVSHYRLTAHLLLAVILFAVLLWQAIDELHTKPRYSFPNEHCVRSLTLWLGGLVLVAMTWGGLMAGLQAGPMFPTFPTMNGAWLPSGMGGLVPLWINLFDNPAAVHFVHRVLALCVLGAVGLLWWQLRRASPPLQLARYGLLLGVVCQVALGALTVLDGSAMMWASLHQVNALTLLGWIVFLMQQLSAPVKRCAINPPFAAERATRPLQPSA